VRPTQPTPTGEHKLPTRRPVVLPFGFVLVDGPCGIRDGYWRNDRRSPTQRRASRRRLLLHEILDGTVVTAAAPRIGIALHVSSTAIGLVITSYFIAVAVLTPLGGWMAARFGTELRGVRQTRSRR
jgi:hypothetical protein